MPSGKHLLPARRRASGAARRGRRPKASTVGNAPSPLLQADRRQLQQIIAGLSDGVILIEPDRTIAWANEAALAMHGVGGVEELGADVADYRRRFELRYLNQHRVGRDDHPMERVLAGETFRDVVVEVAPTGEAEPRWTHAVRSLVLTDAAGEPDCLVLVIDDATERFEAEERFERAFAANPAPAVICRLHDLRYVKVNQGFLELTGHEREDVIGRSVYELDVLEGAEKKDLAVQRLRDGATIPQMEAVLRLPKGDSKAVVVAGQPLEVAGQACMLLTFVDLEARKKAEAALRQSEERFAKAFRLTPVPTVIATGREVRLLDVNDAFAAATGYAAMLAIGRTAHELKLWESSAEARAFQRTLRRSGSARGMELRLRAKDGALLDCLASAETVTVQDRPCVLCTFQDISARKHSERELVAAIEAAMRDGAWFSKVVMDKLAELRQPRRAEDPGASLDDLTPREQDILGLLCEGLADKEIADRLGLSGSTVRNGLSAVYKKLGVRRRNAAVAWARERGFSGDRPAKGGRRQRRT
jgi:PAS domain S-box-containing protein